MQLISLLPRITLENVRSEMGWEVKCAPMLVETAPPTEDELRLLRVNLDPEGILYRLMWEGKLWERSGTGAPGRNAIVGAQCNKPGCSVPGHRSP